MLDIRGKYNSAKVFTDVIEQEAIAQIMLLLNQEFTKDSKVRMKASELLARSCKLFSIEDVKKATVPIVIVDDIP